MSENEIKNKNLPYHSGDQNTAIGYRALQPNSGDQNTAIGYHALVSGDFDNIAVGYRALNISSGDQNTAIGYHALTNSGIFTITANDHPQDLMLRGSTTILPNFSSSDYQPSGHVNISTAGNFYLASNYADYEEIN